MTPSQYLNKKKIDKAIELLLSTELSILNIAFECGFNNIEYFDKIFKKTMGLTPLRYRQTKRNRNLILLHYLEIIYKFTDYSNCTNSKNWTKNDMCLEFLIHIICWSNLEDLLNLSKIYFFNF